MTEEQEALTPDGVEIPAQVVPKPLRSLGPTGVVPVDMTIPAPVPALAGDDEDEDDDDESEDIDVVYNPDEPAIYFNEHKFRRQADASMDLLDVAQKNLKGVFDSGMATDPETAILLYTATVNGAAKLIDQARKLATVQHKNAADRIAASGSSGNPRPVKRDNQPEPPAQPDIESVPTDAAETIANSRFNPR
jgi:hypothetical protein